MIIKQCISDEEAYITGDKLFFSEKSNTSGPPWSSIQLELYVISCSNSRGTKGGWIWKENRHNQNYNHPQTFVHDVTMTVAGIHTEAVLDTLFFLYHISQFMWYLNSAASFSNEAIPFDCLPVQVLETTETFYIQYAISACALNVFYFLSWKDRASRFIFFKIKMK